jgi:hypothetical protein
MKKLISTIIVLLISSYSYSEVEVTAKINDFIAVWDGCAVNIEYISGTQPTSTPQCGVRMKNTNSDNVEHTRMICSALLAAHTAQRTVTMGFPTDGNACNDCGCPINWATVHKN